MRAAAGNLLEELQHQPRGALRFPRHPASWYHFCAASELAAADNGVFVRTCMGRELIGFRGGSGAAVVMDARCCHMGSSLGGGCVVDGKVECPLHGWQFGETGSCEVIPAGVPIPDWAQQRTYPAVERYGHIFFFLGEQPSFDFPLYDGVEEGELCAAPVFQFQPDCAWYMIGANGFDTQHFRLVHDRVLCGEPEVMQLSKHALRVRMQLEVSIENTRDRLVAAFFGRQIQFTLTSWGGTLLLVTAEFKRTTTYGMVCIMPETAGTSLYRNIILVKRSGGSVMHALLDYFDCRLRRWFVREFVRPDVSILAGTRASISRLIEADREVRDYFYWVSSLSDDNRKAGEAK